ncbi:MAG: phosphodiester glycosidase family protein [Chloroflexota bacterium]
MNRAVTSPRRTLVLTLLPLLLGSILIAHPAQPAQAAIAGAEEVTPVAPGATLTTFAQMTGHGPVRGAVLTIDLQNPQTSIGLLTPGPLAAAEPLSQLVARSGAVAAVNGDFFDQYYTNAPYGNAIADGQLLKGPIFSWTRVAGVGQDGRGRIAEVFLDGAVVLPDGERPIDAFNQHNIQPNGIGLFTTVWGPASRGRAVERAQGVHELRVRNGVAVAHSDQAGAGWIEPDEFVLLGREEGAAALAQVPIGAPVQVRVGPRSDAPAPFAVGLGGKEILLRGGQIADVSDGAPQPRTAVGFSGDGATMFLVTVDGRQRSSTGMTLRELAELLLSIGASDAMNLDGGGSTTLLARRPGEAGAELINRPSSGRERPIPNGLGLFVAPGSGQLAGLRIVPALGEGEVHVFQGTSRTLVAKGFDETYGPAQAGEVRWRALTPEIGAFEAGGVFRAGQPGVAVVEAEADSRSGKSARGERTLIVLPLAGLAIDAVGMDFAPGAGPGFIAVRGLSPDGRSAQIEPRDVALSYDPSLLEIVPVDHKHFQVTPKVPYAMTAIRAHAGGHTAELPVMIGLAPVVVTEFEDVAGWGAVSWGGTASVAAGEGMFGQALVLDFDFTQGGAQRGASARPSPPLQLPGVPLRLGLWVHGQEQGEQLVFTLAGADGERFDVYAAEITWSGWQYVEVDLPQGKASPLALEAIHVVQNDPTRLYAGQVALDGLAVKVARGP